MPSPAAVANDGAAAAAAAAAQPAVSHTTTATTAIATNTMNGLSAATWPTASPPPGTPHVLSIVVGNTHLHWAMHTGPELDFHPTIFWRYVVVCVVGTTYYILASPVVVVIVVVVFVVVVLQAIRSLPVLEFPGSTILRT